MLNLEESKKRNVERKELIYFPSEMNHLRDHNGFRPGELHVLVGVRGGGKSTLFRTWILESLFNGKRVYIRLSEEKSQDYQDEIVESIGRVMNVDEMTNLKTDSELELKFDQHGSQYFDDLKMLVMNFRADILFFDNFTTSELSDGNVMIQGKNAKFLRNIAQKLNIPVVVASHTSKGFKANVIATGDDSRGNMTLVNTAAYVYSVNVFFGHVEKPTIVFVDKARHHSSSNKSLYRLQFEPKLGIYVKDQKCYRTEIAQILKGIL